MSTQQPFALTLKDQFKLMSQWKDPLVLASAATILYRIRPSEPSADLFEQVEVYITKRLKGARQGCDELYVGGYLHPNDEHACDGARRELEEELGIQLRAEDLSFIGFFGPPVYHSSLMRTENRLNLEIDSEPADPTHRYHLSLFASKVKSDLPFKPSDGEIECGKWMNLSTIIQTYPDSSRFNYPHVLFAWMTYLSTNRVLIRPPLEPGSYLWELPSPAPKSDHVTKNEKL